MSLRTPETVEPAWIRRVNCLLICGSLPLLIVGAFWQPWIITGVVPVALVASHRADIASGQRGLGCAIRDLVRTWRQPPVK